MRVLGEGGMGTVYAAVHEAIEKPVALKVLHREYSNHPDVIERFKREAVSSSRIKHPNVIDVFDFGQLDDGCFFIAMEFLEGKDLGDTLTRVGSFPPEEAVAIILQVGRALQAAHASGVVHRDLKPENIFLQTTPDGEQIVKLVDFGIAQLRQAEESTGGAERKRRLTKTGMIFGTPEYMAPEQARGVDVDERADIYAAGVILYELLAGGVPFTGQSFLDVLNHHVLTPVPSLGTVKPELAISLELETALLRALEKKPQDRFPSVKDFVDALSKTPEAARSGALPRGSSPRASLGSEPNVPSHPTAMLGTPRATPLSASATVGELDYVVPTNSGPSLAVIAAGILVVVLGIGGFAVYRFRETQRAEASAPAVEEIGPGDSAPAPSDPVREPPATDSVEAPVASALPADSASAKVESAPAKVVLRVETVPSGALVRLDGAQVCDRSPCEVSVDRDAEVRFTAQSGRRTGALRVLATADQRVVLTLSAPSAPSAPKPSTEGKLCEVTVDGLKILRPCQ